METFEARIEEAGRGGGFVTVPASVLSALGGGGRIPVRAAFDGIAYAGSITSMGGAMVLGILKDIRAQLDKDAGDTVTVTLERDTSERTVDVPDDLAAALAAAGLTDAFAALSYTTRKEHARGVTEAKKPETRERRIEKVVASLSG